jgi:hypothetical protein
LRDFKAFDTIGKMIGNRRLNCKACPEIVEGTIKTSHPEGHGERGEEKKRI